MRMIYIRQESAFVVLRYLCLPDGQYYGGNTTEAFRLDHGPHITHHVGSLLNLIARLANEEGQPYDMGGGHSGQHVKLQPEMDAGEIAGILGVDVQKVLDRYRVLVRPTESTS